ncbi:single-stranded-DNA-specific exonuclease [Terrihabitans soli]|uniref:Single-stranded-DNA-specific exonuclease RecJ n=1 Tax=Terrihabitans soli TaxID=708113 RepID=A0A6S6QNN8_9HYPH|nr:single-stranded-DNA-specific exonuclease RecJ [Terrihabitans soli]BCJ90569.1 single-stranded-DNA-specific exonuclease [Terrihabitans soli]
MPTPQALQTPAPREAAPALLGVNSSFTGRFWRERLDSQGQSLALAIAQRHGVPEVLARVLAGRGIGLDAVGDYLSPNIRSLLPEPYRFTDMEAAARRIARAVEAGERVAIFGDYDVDGATSSAVLASLLKAAGTPHRIYIPDRIFEGYGPNAEAIKTLAEEGAKLLVTVDCGTTSHAALAEASRLRMDVVVLDHHQVGETLPEVAALVNPKRHDDISGHDYLAAVGVVFITVVAVNRLLRQNGFWTAERSEPDLLSLLDLVALGTVADVVPLTGINRAFVIRGLQAMGQRRRPGLRALADAARMRGAPSPYHLGFLIGPRINAGGRIGRAELGALLLTCDDEAESQKLALELDRLNGERQEVEKGVLADAEMKADLSADVVMASGMGWHPGVVGLVAARLKERASKPAFAITFSNGVGTGSGRSIPGVDIGAAVRAAVEEGLLVKGGGHAMAAGITVEETRFDAFAAFLRARLASDVAAARREDVLKIDGVLTAASLTPGLYDEIQRAGPFGAGNSEPIFALSGHILMSVEEVGSGGHLRLRLKAPDGSAVTAMAFRAVGQPLGEVLPLNRGKPVEVAGCLQKDEWNGRTSVSMRVLDAAAG